MAEPSAGQDQYIAKLVREADPDRYLSALYAPAQKRAALLSLAAFNVEISRIRDVIRDPLPGEVRLQWWRDALIGEAETDALAHPVAAAFLATIGQYDLPVGVLENYFEARIFDLYDDAMPSVNDLEGYCGETAGALIQFASLILDPEAAKGTGEAAGHAACAQAITGIIASLPVHRARGQCFVPDEILQAAGLDRQNFLSSQTGEGGAMVVAALEALARDHLGAFNKAAGELPKSLLPAYLPLAPVPARLNATARAGAEALSLAVGISPLRRNWAIAHRAFRGFPKGTN